MGKLNRYGLYILGIASIIVLITLIFPGNNIISAVMMVNIVLVSITISIILTFISSEKKQRKIPGKAGRYLMYVTSIITIAGFIFKVNRIAYGKTIIKIGLIGFFISMVLILINVKNIQHKKNSN